MSPALSAAAAGDRPRVLIIRLSAIGDVVVTTPVSRALREALPDAHLGWAVEPRAADVVRGNPYLDAVLVWERPRGLPRPRDIASLRALLRPHRFEWAIDCQGNLRSALVAKCSGARNIVGNRGAKEHADLFYRHKIRRRSDDTSSRQRCLDLLAPLGISSTDRRMVVPVTDADRAEAARALGAAGVPAGSPYACLVPATTWPQKHWYEERWSELAVLLDAMGLAPVLLGGPADKPMAARIMEGARGKCRSAAGETSLKAAAAVLEGAVAAVAVDTALLHIAAAMGTPTVGLAGASYWPGFKDYDRFTLLREPLPCSPCLHRPSCDGRFDCMRALTPHAVLAAIRTLPGVGSESGSSAAPDLLQVLP